MIRTPERDDPVKETAVCPVCGSPLSVGSVCSRCGAQQRSVPSASADPRDWMSESDWETLLFAPLWVFNAVAGADGKLDRRETDALMRVIDGREPEESNLMYEVLGDCAQRFDQIAAAYQADGRGVDAGLTAVRHVLETRTSQAEARRFKRDLVTIGAQIAHASGGGPFGLAGRVGASERSALDLIVGFLDLSPGDVPGVL